MFRGIKFENKSLQEIQKILKNFLNEAEDQTIQKAYYDFLDKQLREQKRREYLIYRGA